MELANIFVLGLEGKNVASLRSLPHADAYRFLPLLTLRDLQYGEVYISELFDQAMRQLEAFGDRIDAIIGFWDFPVTTLVPLLCRRFGLRSASLESVVKCEHKYWSRLEQRKVVDERAYPRFALLDLDDAEPRPEGLRYPMWLKPVKSYSSELAFRVADDDEFREAVAAIREGVGRLGRSFEFVLRQLDLPPEIAEAGGQACLAEESMSGDQATVEGYSRAGRVEVYGIVDSLLYPGTPSFLRYQYPTALPARTRQRMTDLSKAVISGIGLDDSTFCIEFFCGPGEEDVRILEINPRHSQSHAELFRWVDGVPNHHCMVDLALGRDPAPLPHRKGPYAAAAKCHLRRFSDGVVRHRAGREQLERLQRDVPGVLVVPVVEEGMRLSDAPQAHDSYSYELAHVYVGGDDVRDLEEKYDRCVAALDFRFEHEDEEEKKDDDRGDAGGGKRGHPSEGDAATANGRSPDA